MELSMNERRAVVWKLAKGYGRATKKEKGRVVDALVRLTGYHRCYASWVLGRVGRKVAVKGRGGERWIFRADPRVAAPRRRGRTYGREVVSALRRIWEACGCLCGKRLAPYLQEVVPILERHGEVRLGEETRGKLCRISAATIDRLLAPERRKLTLKGRGGTKPGSLLKSQIPVRTFAEWDERRPGFLEVDLVAHDGGNASGDFLQTLDATDVHTGWTETQAIRNKAQIWTLQGMKRIVERLPFPVAGLDSDNGSEFINKHLLAYCEANAITFTRSRPWRKNDNCFVEQKNSSVVRRAVGYGRHDTEEELALLNELYGLLRPYTNFFQPVMKLKEKVRVGSRVTKRCDEARTPYRRVLECPAREGVAAAAKRRLRAEHERLNPAELRRRIDALQDRLSEIAREKRARPVGVARTRGAKASSAAG